MTYRIARLGTLKQPVPAVEYGGIQRSMAQMTAFQAALCAHDITVYASADSAIVDFTADIAHKLGLQTAMHGDALRIQNADGRVGQVRLRHTGQKAIGYSHPDEESLQAELIGLFLCDEMRQPYDLIHSHYPGITSNILLPRDMGAKTLTHQHTGSLPNSYGQTLFPVIAISESQAQLVRTKYGANVVGVVPHGLDSFTHDFSPLDAGYAAWIGRFLEEKGAHRAVAIARTAGMPLVMAGMIYEDKPKSRQHFERDVLPLIDIHDPGLLTRMAGMNAAQAADEIKRLQRQSGVANPVIYAGPASDAQKQALYGFARATLFPISWPEPFGRVMIESMACGTPVIANATFGRLHCGAVEEVIDEGRSGFLMRPRNEAECVEQGALALVRVGGISRAGVRATFDEKWTSARVARQLDELYRMTVPPIVAAPNHKLRIG